MYIYVNIWTCAYINCLPVGCIGKGYKEWWEQLRVSLKMHTTIKQIQFAVKTGNSCYF